MIASAGRAGFEYVVDEAGVHHAVLRYAPAAPWAGVLAPVLTPWRWDGEPSQLACMDGERADVAQRLPDEEHGHVWGEDVLDDAGTLCAAASPSAPLACRQRVSPSRCTDGLGIVTDHAAEGWLVEPGGRRIQAMCRVHALACVREYEEFLGELWTFSAERV